MSEQEVSPRPELKHSGIGIASFVISIVAGLLTFIVIVIAGVMESSTPGGMDDDSVESMIVGISIIGLMIVNLVAAGLGIGGCFQANRAKIFAILGTIFSLGVFVLTAGVMMLGIAME